MINAFKKTIFSAAAACLLLCSACYAGPGTTGAQFLKINPSARASGMAGACSGIADDVFAVYSNPAGLVNMEKGEFAATYLSYFADVKYGYISYAPEAREKSALGFGLTYLLIDDIEKRDESEVKLGEFNAKDISLAVAYARKDVAPGTLENLSVGAALKIISSEIDQNIAFTGALDLSAMYSPVEDVNTVLAVENISPGIKFIEETDPLPLNIKAAVSYAPLLNLNLGGEIDEYVADNKFYAAIGAEYWPVKQIALRAGYRFGYHTSSLGSNVGLGAGMGFRIWSSGLDYAFVPFGDLGDTHRVTFSTRF